MKNSVSKDIIEKWLTAWCLSRELPLPVKYKSGFKVDVGFEKQKSRYVFPEINEDIIQLSKEITEPWIYLKFCVLPEEIQNKVPDRWKVQPQGFMMHCTTPMKILKTELSPAYKFEIENYNSTAVIRILTQNNELCAEGRVIIVEDIALYDRIFTENKHKRKGLATFLMKELESIALSKKIYTNFLVATSEGKLLYKNLGWELYSYYTSIVIEK